MDPKIIQWLTENYPESLALPLPIHEVVLKVLNLQKEKYDSLEKEFRAYVNCRGPSKEYIDSGGWRG